MLQFSSVTESLVVLKGLYFTYGKKSAASFNMMLYSFSWPSFHLQLFFLCVDAAVVICYSDRVCLSFLMKLEVHLENVLAIY